MRGQTKTVRVVVLAAIIGSVVMAGTAAAVTSISGGGAGSAGDLGGADAVDPGTVTAGQTTGNHLLTFSAASVSKDGGTDVIMVEVPNELANAGVSANGVTVENASSGSDISISSSPSLVDGTDGDGVADTLRFAVSPTGGGAVDVNVRADVSTSAPNVSETTEYEFTATVNDSDGSTAGPTAFGTLTVEPAGMDNATIGDSTNDDDGTTEMDGMDGESTDMDDSDSTEMEGDDSDMAGGNATDGETTSSGGPGFTLGLALTALVAATLVALRRRD